MSAQGKRPWRTPALRLLEDSPSGGVKVYTVQTEGSQTSGTMVVMTVGGMSQTVYTGDDWGPS